MAGERCVALARGERQSRRSREVRRREEARHDAVTLTVYDRARYDYLLDYKRPVEPPLNEADAAWAQSLLGALKPAP